MASAFYSAGKHVSARSTCASHPDQLGYYTPPSIKVGLVTLRPFVFNRADVSSFHIFNILL